MNLLQRIYKLLLPEERKTSKKVATAVFLTAMLDFVGLASLLPVLYYLLDGGENMQVALWFCLVAVSIVLIKNLAVVSFARFQNGFLMSLYKRLSYTLFASYYKRGLLFIREQGTNRLAYEINYLCFAFSQSMLAPMLRMAGDGLLVLLVTIALLLYDGLTVMVLYASFLPFMILYIWGVRKKVRKYGEEELQARSSTILFLLTHRTSLTVFPTCLKSLLSGLRCWSARCCCAFLLHLLFLALFKFKRKQGDEA